MEKVSITSLLKEKEELLSKLQKEEVAFSKIMDVVDGFLILAVQFEKNPTKNFEHQVNLARKCAKDLLLETAKNKNSKVENDFIDYYIATFSDRFHN